VSFIKLIASVYDVSDEEISRSSERLMNPLWSEFTDENQLQSLDAVISAFADLVKKEKPTVGLRLEVP
jgi:hypothetical protein